MLVGRATERSILDRLLAGARDGTSGALVLAGEPGIGKTALLEYAAEQAADLPVLRGAGVESEAELPYAGLHLLMRPLLKRLDVLPEVQAQALRGALGLGPASGDGFLVGLAVLSLLAEAGPLLCLVDDVQWLDKASAEALLFAARRLDSEGVAIIFAARGGPGFGSDDQGFVAGGLPEVWLGGLDAAAAIALLDGQERASALSPEARYRLLSEAAGNPLALLELPQAMPAAPAGAVPLTERLREAFEGQVRRLPETTQRLLLVAALDESGDLAVVLRAAKELGAAPGDLDQAEQAGMVQVTAGDLLAFRHPLVRAAVQQGAPLSRRLAAHTALAAALDPHADADRRAWHLAMAATGPDEEIAAELERTAARAGDRRGHAAAAAAYERAARLTADPIARLRRLTLAAEATAESGNLTRAADLALQAAPLTAAPSAAGLGVRREGTADSELVARLMQVRGMAAFVRGDMSEGHRLMTDSAVLIEERSPERAASMLIEAAHMGWFGGERELADSLDRLAALRLDPEGQAAALVRLLILATAPILGRRTPEEVRPETVMAEARRRCAGDAHNLILTGATGIVLGLDAQAQEIMASLAAEARRQSRIGFLPTALFYLATVEFYLGRHDDARATADEALAIGRGIGQQRWADQLAEVLGQLAAVTGDEAECRRLADQALASSPAANPVWGVPWTYGALGLLDLGLGRAEAALSRLEELAEGRRRFHIIATRSTPDLVEAAVRVGRPEAAEEPLALYRRWAAQARLPWIDALLHRCQAMLAADDAADQHFTAALRLHEQDSRAFEHARTRLLYGEWLRRVRRKTDARAQLRAAQEAFDRLGATPWADRARTELTATGLPGAAAAQEKATGVLALLTPQELQIVRLAAQGLANKDIAAQLFLSPRTVGHHLYKAYPKLGILSRGELDSLPLDG